MTKLYERLAGFNALVGLLTLVIGLAAVPQTAVGIIPRVPDCQGLCSVSCGFLSNQCNMLNFSTCNNDCTTCFSVQINNTAGICQSCMSATCRRRV